GSNRQPTRTRQPGLDNPHHTTTHDKIQGKTDMQATRHGLPLSASGSRRSLHRLDLGLDERDLVGVKVVLRTQLLVDRRDRLRPVNVRRLSEVLERNVLPYLRWVVLGDLQDAEERTSELGLDVLEACLCGGLV